MMMVLRALLLGLSLAVTPAFAGTMALLGAGKAPGAAGLSCSYSPVTTGTQSVAYTGATPSASGGTPAYTFSETGSLPTGLTINSSTGVISGTPSVNGSFPGIQVSVTDSLSATANCGTSFTLVISAGGSASYAFIASASSAGSGAAVSSSIAIGTAAANRIIVIAGGSSGGVAISTVTLNSTSCTIDVSSASSFVASCPGSTYGSGSQTAVVTWASGSFNQRGFSAWAATGMSSTTVSHIASGSGSSTTINVAASDFMFLGVSVGNGTPTYSGNTQAPSNTQSIIASFVFSADWSVVSTNASFTIGPTAPNQSSYAAATYH